MLGQFEKLMFAGFSSPNGFTMAYYSHFLCELAVTSLLWRNPHWWVKSQWSIRTWSSSLSQRTSKAAETMDLNKRSEDFSWPANLHPPTSIHRRFVGLVNWHIGKSPDFRRKWSSLYMVNVPYVKIMSRNARHLTLNHPSNHPFYPWVGPIKLLKMRLHSSSQTWKLDISYNWVFKWENHRSEWRIFQPCSIRGYPK